MYQILKQHPDIFLGIKEAHFFGTDLESPSFIRDAAKYYGNFSTHKGEKRIGEVAIYYLYSERAAQEIKNALPESRIIIMLRNPVDMIHSLHSEFLFNGGEDIVDFSSALQAESERKEGLRIPQSSRVPKEALFYRNIARFSDQVERYLSVFDRENVHFVILDDLKKNIALEYEKVLRFLDVGPIYMSELGVVNPNKQVRSPIFNRIINPTSPSIRRAVRAVMPERMLQTLVPALKRLNTRYKARPPMDEGLRWKLQKEFEPDIRRLSYLIKRDLSDWL